MKVSEITAAHVAAYLRLDAADKTEEEFAYIAGIMAAATGYLTAYTGLPVSAETADSLDAHEDIAIAFLALCQSMYDDRGMTVDSGSANRVVETILGLHCKNLVG